MEPLPSTLRSGNLSVLKKHWEQQQSTFSHRTQPQATPSSSADCQTHTSPSAGRKLTPTSQASEAQPDPTTRSHQPEHLMDMEPSRDAEGAAAAAEVPDCEKPSVPLNSLKMMFEKRENPEKASLPSMMLVTPRTSLHTNSYIKPILLMILLYVKVLASSHPCQ